MNVKEQIMLELSRNNANLIASYIGTDVDRFNELLQFVFTEKEPVPMRASWVVTNICDTFPNLIEPYVGKIISYLPKTENSGTRRNLLRTLSMLTIPENFEGELYDLCYKYLQAVTEPIAVKVHSMQILYNIGKQAPELLRELQLVLEELKYNDSGAIRSRTGELLRKISQKIPNL